MKERDDRDGRNTHSRSKFLATALVKEVDFGLTAFYLFYAHRSLLVSQIFCTVLTPSCCVELADSSSV